MSGSQTLTGRISRIQLHKPDGFFIAHISCTGESRITTEKVVGVISKEAPLSYKDLYTFVGRDETNRWGRQFKFSAYYPATPTGEQDIRNYLDKCMHIGPVRAKDIWDKFGQDSIQKIKEDPSCLTDIRGITKQRAEAISKDLREREESEQLILSMGRFLGDKGLPDRVVQALIKTYGKSALKEVMTNPYGVLLPLGVDFLTVDRFYLSAGNDPKATIRVEKIFDWVFEQDRSGSTWIEINQMFARMSKYLGEDMSRDEIWATIQDLWARGSIELRKGCREVDEEELEYVSSKLFADSEEFTAKQVAYMVADKLLDDKKTPWPKLIREAPDGTVADDEQVQCYEDATQARIGLITGSPGCGKSWCIARIVDSLQGHCWVCALANKAVLRLRQTFRAQGVSHYNSPVTTIHAMLEASADGDRWSFKRNAINPLDPADASVIIVDEASMIDSVLLSRILEAMPAGGRLLLVGDPDQLSPIGRGAPFRDLLDLDMIPHGHLTNIKRNEGLIVDACQKIREKSELFWMGHSIKQEEDNLQMVHCNDDTEDVMNAVEMIDKYESEVTKRGYRSDPSHRQRGIVASELDLQLIVALNEKGSMSRKELNERLRNYFNPYGRWLSSKKFREGDKVICLKNGHLAPVSDAMAYAMGLHKEKMDFDPKAPLHPFRVVNGDIFFVIHIAEKFMVLEGDSGRCFMPLTVVHSDDNQRGDRSDVYNALSASFHIENRNASRRSQDLEGYDELVAEEVLSRSLLSSSSLSESDFDLAYAITCHKFQGSSAPVTIVALDPAALAVADRHWIYTAISRAEARCYLVGATHVLKPMIERSNMWSRTTFLCDAFEEYLEQISDDEVFRKRVNDRIADQEIQAARWKEPHERQASYGTGDHVFKLRLHHSRLSEQEEQDVTDDCVDDDYDYYEEIDWDC